MRNPLRRFELVFYQMLWLGGQIKVNMQDLTKHQANVTSLIELFENMFNLLEKLKYLSLRSYFLPKRRYSIVRSDCEV